jgi:NAD(P)-dependent dehydrogenase (short-subunit alcohol dehydrogenase family)
VSPPASLTSRVRHVFVIGGASGIGRGNSEAAHTAGAPGYGRRRLGSQPSQGSGRITRSYEVRLGSLARFAPKVIARCCGCE